MTHHLFAAEGGYQGFVLTGAEKLWLVLALVAAVFGITVGLFLMRGVLKADQGSQSMRDIAKDFNASHSTISRLGLNT